MTRDKLWLAHWFGHVISCLYAVSGIGCAITAAVLYRADPPPTWSDVSAPLFIAAFGAAYCLVKSFISERRAERAILLWGKEAPDDDRP